MRDKVIDLLKSGPRTISQIAVRLKIKNRNIKRCIQNMRVVGEAYVFGWTTSASKYCRGRPIPVYAIGSEADAPMPKPPKKVAAKKPRPKKYTKIKDAELVPKVGFSNGWNKSWKAFRHPHDVAFFGEAR